MVNKLVIIPNNILWTRDFSVSSSYSNSLIIMTFFLFANLI